MLYTERKNQNCFFINELVTFVKTKTSPDFFLTGKGCFLKLIFNKSICIVENKAI